MARALRASSLKERFIVALCGRAPAACDSKLSSHQVVWRNTYPSGQGVTQARFARHKH